MDLTQFMLDTAAEFPDFTLKRKDQSLFMKVVGFLLMLVTFGKKTFMTEYLTTIKTTVYVPVGWDTWAATKKLNVLRHERVHMRQMKKYSYPLYAFLYLLFPLPFGLAWFRARFEWEAYTESMRASVDQQGIGVLDDATFRQSVIELFVDGDYLWMWPFKSTVSKWYDEAKTQIQNEKAR